MKITNFQTIHNLHKNSNLRTYQNYQNDQKIQHILIILDKEVNEIMDLLEYSDNSVIELESCIKIRHNSEYYEFSLHSELYDKLRSLVINSKYSDNSNSFQLWINSELFIIPIDSDYSDDFEEFLNEEEF